MKITGYVSDIPGQSTSPAPVKCRLVIEGYGTEIECRKALALMMKSLEDDQP
jgi:hypothetical protein